MPFANIRRFIPCFIEIFRHRTDCLGQGHAIPIAAALRRIHARLQTSTRRAADRLAGIGVFKLNSLPRKLHQIRSGLLIDGIPTLLVAEIKDNVRPHVNDSSFRTYFRIAHVSFNRFKRVAKSNQCDQSGDRIIKRQAGDCRNGDHKNALNRGLLTSPIEHRADESARNSARNYNQQNFQIVALEACCHSGGYQIGTL